MGLSSNTGRIRKGRQIGTGSLGPLFEAHDSGLDRLVAVRELGRALLADSALREECLRRLTAMVAISHPNVITVHAVDMDHDPPRVVLELLQGRTLEDSLSDKRPTPPERAAILLVQALEGIEQIHLKGIAHRDIRPGNLFVEHGVLKIGDFGASALGGDGNRSDQTVRYSAPELLSDSASVGVPADLYSLGLVFYELVLGPERFLRVVADRLLGMKTSNANTDTALLWHELQVSSAELPRLREVDPTIPEQFSRVIARMVSKPPESRPQSARHALQALATMRKWTAMVEAVRQPARHLPADLPADEIWSHLSPQRLATAAVVVLILAVLSITVPRLPNAGEDSGSMQGLETATETGAEQPAASSTFAGPESLLRHLRSLASSEATATLRVAGLGDDGSLSVGAPLRFELAAPGEVYAALFVVSSNGTVSCIYPNLRKPFLRLSGERAENLPSSEDELLGISLQADHPIGSDDVFLLTSPHPLLGLPPGHSILRGWLMTFPFSTRPGSPAVELAKWVEQHLKTRNGSLTHAQYKTVEAGD